MDELEEIKLLERDIELLADLETKLGRYVSRESEGEHRQLVEAKLRDVSRRADTVEARLNELIAQRLLKIAQQRRRSLAAGTAAPQPVRFLGIEEAHYYKARQG